MKTTLQPFVATLTGLFLSISSLSAQNASGDAPGNAEAADEKPFDPTPYGLDRFQKLLSKSPFDFDVPPPPEEVKPEPLADWHVGGLSETQDYTNVTIVNIKNGQRLVLTKNANSIEVDRKGRKDSLGDTFRLVGISFEADKPKSRKSVIAVVQKNEEPAAEVRWDSKADQMRPMGNVPNLTIPKLNSTMGGGGVGPGMNQGQMPGAAPGSVPMGNNPQGNTLPQNAGLPNAQGIPAQGGNGTLTLGTANGTPGNQALVDLLQRTKSQQPGQATPPGASGNNPLGRRRVVLPTPTETPPPPPTVQP